MYFALILFSFIVSMASAGIVFKKKRNKRISILLALVINTVFLASTFYLMYMTNEDMRIMGIGDSKIYYMIIAIPLITWVNAFVLLFMKVEETSI